jgi:REP element-mobilizing transposase RayT
MGRPLRIEFENAVYHITSRGNERKKIYRDDGDKEKFLGLLEDYKNRYNFLIHCFVLMDNHYHLVIETLRPNLIKIMHGLNSGYTGYFNKKYKRSGHLFQGRYKAIIVDKENYLLELSRYVHLNPLRAKIINKPQDYKWSSYGGYIRKKEVNNLNNYNWLLSIFGNEEKKSRRQYKEFVEEGIAKKLENPVKRAVGNMILGSKEFIDSILVKIDRDEIGQEIANRNEILKTINPQEVIKEVSNKYKIKPIEITNTGTRNNEARNVAIYITRNVCELSNKETAKIFGGIKESAVSKVVKRLENNIKTNKALKQITEQLMSNVKT